MLLLSGLFSVSSMEVERNIIIVVTIYIFEFGIDYVKLVVFYIAVTVLNFYCYV